LRRASSPPFLHAEVNAHLSPIRNTSCNFETNETALVFEKAMTGRPDGPSKPVQPMNTYNVQMVNVNRIDVEYK
jgi:hypothetical protein